MTARGLAIAAALSLLAACAAKPARPPPVVFPAAQHKATIAQIDSFLPRAKEEAALCQGADRRLLDTYRRGLEDLRQSPAGGADSAAQTMALFDAAYARCRQKMAVLDRELTAIDARCRAAPLRLGMSDQQVLRGCWGAPEHVNRRQSAAHSHEQWVYPDLGTLDFTDGVLTAIHEAGASRASLKRMPR